MNFEAKKQLRKLSHQNKMFTWIYKKANKAKVYIYRHVSDEEYAKRHYKENTGKTLDLNNPVTFNEKLWWLKLFNRDPLLTKCSDKYLVREYVEECGLGHILNELYGVYNNADEIDYDALPEKFILKCNHASDANVICRDKTTFDRKKAAKKLNAVLNSDYYLQSREWNYKNIKPCIICERFLEDTHSGVGLVDYRFLCFGGIAKALLLGIDATTPDGSHSTTQRRNLYDLDFNLLDVTMIHDDEHFPPELVPRPANLDEMRGYAEILSKPFPHCRVDFFNIDGKIYMGEMTFYHGACRNPIKPEEWARKMGDWIDLSLVKVRREI